MTTNEYLKNISECKINDEKVRSIEKIYSTVLPEILKRMVSFCDDSIFLENDKRIIAFSEIINAEKELHVPFSKHGILPIVDCGDNDFIVYIFNEKMWAEFNIVDEVIFMKRANIEDVF